MHITTASLSLSTTGIFVGGFAICTLPCIDAMAVVFACDIYGTMPLLR